MKWRLNVRTDKIDDEAAIWVSSSGCVEKRLSVWQGNRAEGGRQSTSVGVGVAEIEDRREITVYGGSGRGRAYKDEEAEWEKKINEDVMAHIFYTIHSPSQITSQTWSSEDCKWARTKPLKTRHEVVPALTRPTLWTRYRFVVPSAFTSPKQRQVCFFF